MTVGVEALPTPEELAGPRARSTFVERVARRAADAPLALCVGIDPAPASLALLAGIDTVGRGSSARATRAGAMERFGGLVVEASRDHAVAIKPQLAWFESAGAPGIRALERVVAYAHTAGLLVVIDGKRGDVPHSAGAYADAWLGDDAASGIGGDALTVNASIGADALGAMAEIAAARACALYVLLHTSNPGASRLQDAELADGSRWWQLLAADIVATDVILGRTGVVGAVVGATRPEVVDQVRAALPHAPLLLPGVGSQGGDATILAAGAIAGTPTSLVPVSRSMLPTEPCGTAAFRYHVASAAARLAAELAAGG